jgi:hypothetical protein
MSVVFVRWGARVKNVGEEIQERCEDTRAQMDESFFKSSA